MTREDCDSILTEALSVVKTSERDALSSNSTLLFGEYQIGIVGYGAPSIAPHQFYVPSFGLYSSNSNLGNSRFDLSSLKDIASFGLQSVRALAAGTYVADNYLENRILGCRRRTSDGKRFVCIAENVPSHERPNDAPFKLGLWSPTYRDYQLAQWSPFTYEVTPIKFSMAGSKSIGLTITGNNQYLLVKNLDKFLGITYIEEKNIPWGEVQLRAYEGKGYPNNYMVDTNCTMPRFGSCISSCKAIPSSTDYEYSRIPRSVTAKLFLTDNYGHVQEIFSETVAWIGWVYLYYMFEEYVENGVVKSSPLKPSGIYGFYTPIEFAEWTILSNAYHDGVAIDLGLPMWNKEPYLSAKTKTTGEYLKALQKTIQTTDDSPHWEYVVERTGAGSPAYSTTKSAYPVFLGKGRTYTISMSIDNAYVPLELTEIPTIQSRLFISPLKV